MKGVNVLYLLNGRGYCTTVYLLYEIQKYLWVFFNPENLHIKAKRKEKFNKTVFIFEFLLELSSYKSKYLNGERNE